MAEASVDGVTPGEAGGGEEMAVESSVLVDGSSRFFALVDEAMGAIAQTGQLAAQSGQIAQNNFITTTKAQDLDYLEGKRIVSLEEAIGVREVASKEVPAGPNTVAAK